MKLRKQKLGILIGLLFISIGFAAVTTILVIDGTISIGSSKETFDQDVIFTRATTNSEGIAYISSDGKSITFSTNELTELGSESTLDFEITNKSRVYDANAIIECTMVDEENIYNDYVSITTNPKEFNIQASKSEDGNLTIRLIKSYSGEGAEIKFSCSINANAIERDNEADEIVISPVTGNTISGRLLDENGKPLANTNIVIIADKSYYATTDSNGYYEIDGLNSGSYPVYIMKNDKTLEEIKEMSNQEIKENALTKGQLITGDMNIIFDNGYVQTETIEYKVIFDTTGGNTLDDEITIKNGEKYGELPTSTRVGFTFDGWWTDPYYGTNITNDSTANLKGNQTLYAHWLTKYDMVINVTPTNGNSASTVKTYTPSDGWQTITTSPITTNSVSCTNGYSLESITIEKDDGNKDYGWKFINPGVEQGTVCDVSYTYDELYSLTLNYTPTNGVNHGKTTSITRSIGYNSYYRYWLSSHNITINSLSCTNGYDINPTRFTINGEERNGIKITNTGIKEDTICDVNYTLDDLYKISHTRVLVNGHWDDGTSDPRTSTIWLYLGDKYTTNFNFNGSPSIVSSCTNGYTTTLSGNTLIISNNNIKNDATCTTTITYQN